MYIYGLDGPYGAVVLHYNSFLEYYYCYQFIDSCKVCSSDLHPNLLLTHCASTTQIPWRLNLSPLQT